MAEHIKLNSKRVIKCVSKHESMYQQFLTEATLLKSLRHSGIPIIYDLEEDEEYLYIIEEYIQGESLTAMVLNQKSISREKVIDFTIQICNIIEYLHNRKPYPVLYLDLKPDHIIVCNNFIKIIDFGAAIYMEKEEVDYSFGTPGFAAPEQFTSLKLDSKADIYAIGCILYFMLTGKNPSQLSKNNFSKINFLNIPDDLKEIIMKCMAKETKDRFQTVSELKEKVSICKHEKNTLIIAVLGSQSRIGVSHIAIGIVSFLNKNKINAIYEEANENAIISYLYKVEKSSVQKEGIYKFKSFEAIPKYNETICINKDKYQVIVKDYGSYETVSSDFWEADIKIALLGTKSWELDRAKDCTAMLQETKVTYLFNLCEKGQAYQAARYLGIKKAYKMPVFFNPFIKDKQVDKLFKEILKEKINKKGRTLFGKWQLKKKTVCNKELGS